MRLSFVLVCIAAALLLSPSPPGLAAESEGGAHNPDSAPWRASDLAVSPSGHYVTYKGETLILIGDSGTHCVAQNVNINHRQWIDDCAARGIRAVHVWSFVAPRQKEDGSVIEARYGYVYPGVTPWARKSTGPNAADGLKQWDLKTFDEGPDGELTHYWPRMRDLCSYAKSRNMVVGITVFFGWPKHNIPQRPEWSYHPFNVANGGWLTDSGELVTQVQLIETPGTEIWRQQWSDAWPARKRTQWVWERFCKKLIDDLGSFGNVFFVFMDEHSYSEGNCGDHFLQFFKKRGQVWVDWGARRGSVDMVYDQFLMRPDNDSRLEAQFGKAPVRPFFGLEEGGASGFNYTSDLLGMVWRYAIGGGHYFHHNDERQETVTTGIMVYDPNTTPFGNKRKVLERLTWLGNASRFFNEHIDELDSMAPHDELTSLGTHCLADPGREYVVYSKSDAAATFTMDLAAGAGKTFDCRFYNPRTGKFGAAFQRQGGNTESFTKLDAQDWALHIAVAGSAVRSGNGAHAAEESFAMTVAATD